MPGRSTRRGATRSGDLELSADESLWVLRRLAELLGWDAAGLLERLAENA